MALFASNALEKYVKNSRVILNHIYKCFRAGSGQELEHSMICTDLQTHNSLFEDENSGHVFSYASSMPPLIAGAAKGKSSPLDYNERQMTGPEWDTPKQLEIAKLESMNAITEIAADDPSISHMKAIPTMWTGRKKLKADLSLKKLNARCVERGDIATRTNHFDPNDCFSPTCRVSSFMCVEAISCIRGQNMCPFDVPGAYLQGKQRPEEQKLLRAPPGFRKYDERGVELYWLTNNPLYGQPDAGGIWNRTINEFVTDKCELERCPQEPCIYSKDFGDNEDGRVTSPLYVDDSKVVYDNTASGKKAAENIKKKLIDEYGVEFGEDNPEDDYFLGANRISSKDDRHRATIRASTYIMTMVERYIPEGNLSQFPAFWSYTPADEALVRAWEAATAARVPATKEFTRGYQALFGSLLHAVKYRPEIAKAMGLLGSCLTFPTQELYDCMMRVLVYLARSPNMGTTFTGYAPDAKVLTAYADSDWATTRSTTGFCMMLGGAAVTAVSRRQHCITMSSTEAELVALADCAIELLYVASICEFMGLEMPDAIEVNTDNKGAYDLCHRFSSAQNSRHIDRKMFKMRELRGAGMVQVKWIPTDKNPADLFTKILSRQPFEKHRKTVLNLPGDTGMEYARRVKMSAGNGVPISGLAKSDGDKGKAKARSLVWQDVVSSGGSSWVGKLKGDAESWPAKRRTAIFGEQQREEPHPTI